MAAFEGRRMLCVRLVVLVPVLLACLAGCRDDVTLPAPGEISRPAEILEIQPAARDIGLRFPGRVRAVRRAELAFNVPGKVIEIPVREGEQLPAGALIARLDPANFAARVAAAQAEYDEARADFERVRTIWEQSRAVAWADVEQRRTVMEVARSRYAASRKDLDDTRLLAPFAGVVARRHVENYQNAQANEPVVSLQDLEQLEIVIHVPERIVRAQSSRTAGYAVFEGLSERRFPVTLKSFAAEADPQTQTYEVVLALTRPVDVTVLPGMSVDVFPLAGSAQAGSGDVLIPIEAVVTSPDGRPFVWLVGSGDMRVVRREIEVRRISGAEAVVGAGLQAGDRIVTAGVHHLHDGMRVHPLAGSG